MKRVPLISTVQNTQVFEAILRADLRSLTKHDAGLDMIRDQVWCKPTVHDFWTISQVASIILSNEVKL